jgi:hypothetical protein
MEIQTPNTAKSLEQHLMERGLVDFDALTLQIMGTDNPEALIAEAKASITYDEETLGNVAGAWETYRTAITTVVATRLKTLIIQVALRDIPQEVLVTRQAILELIGVLRDFERLYSEHITRKGDNN